MFSSAEARCAEIASEVQEIEDSVKVKQDGFELHKTNPIFAAQSPWESACRSFSSSRESTSYVLCSAHFRNGGI
jgi:hypothetical protein